jgi:hypothetical protein
MNIACRSKAIGVKLPMIMIIPTVIIAITTRNITTVTMRSSKY